VLDHLKLADRRASVKPLASRSASFR